MGREQREPSEQQNNQLDIEMEPVGPLQIPMPVVKEQVQPATDGGAAEQSPPEPSADEIEDPLNYLDSAVSLGESYNEHLDKAIEAESCDFCASVLRDLKSRPTEEQVKGVRELRRLKEAMTQDELPDKEELAELVEDFEVVDLGMQV